MVALAVPLLVTACHGGGAGSVLPQEQASTLVQTAGAKIQHVVIIVQENRSLNNLFYGFPGAHTVAFGYDHNNHQIVLKPIGLSTGWDVAHNSNGYYAACNGVGGIIGTDCRMNGFDREYVSCNQPGQPPCPIKHPQYAFVPHSETKPYFDMAAQYVLADQMFASNFDASSYVSHQYIIAGRAAAATNYPYNWWGCPGGASDKIQTILKNPPRSLGAQVPVCFNYRTLGDELDDAGLSWAFYAGKIGQSPPSPCRGGASDTSPDYSQGNGIWSAYQAVKHICYGPDWKRNVISPQTQFFTDIKQGKFRTVTWIVPTCKNSDHAGCYSDTGPSWVSALVNAIGKSGFWSTTAIFIFWDDYGGWYDPEPPAYVDYDGLGFRLPLLIISPYAKRGHVSHVQYEHGSILKFVEDQFGLGRLAASDTRANSPENDCFDFSQPPRKFVPIKAPYNLNYFMRQPLDPRTPDSE